MTGDLLQEIENNKDYKILKRIPENDFNKDAEGETFVAAILDLETMGLDPLKDEIIELGMLRFSFSKGDGILSLIDTYNELQDPGRPIPAEITKITGISDDDVKGAKIDWKLVLERLNNTDLVICHNSGFDRNFLELQTPDEVGSHVKTLPFACTIHDINWHERGYESSKLEYLNFKLGYFYEGHRALVDCWATLNLLREEKGAFLELLGNVRRKDVLICAKNAPFEKKDLLKTRKYRWSDGSGTLPKSWWISLSIDELQNELEWLDDEIFGRAGASKYLPKAEISAKKRYSLRALKIA